MVNIVVVSHSARLAEGVAELAGQMQHSGCRLLLAAGIEDPDNPIGTDAIRVMQAIEEAYTPSGVLLLMDLGSALLSAETALELIDPDMRANVRLCAAPLVEGTLAAVVAASGGASLADTAKEAERALQAKRAQLGEQDMPDDADSAPVLGNDAVEACWTVRNAAGLHARPAARLAAALAPFHAALVLHKGDKHADPRSLNQITLLQVRRGDEIRLQAQGEDAPAALQAFEQLAQADFGDEPTPESGSTPILRGRAVAVQRITAPVFWMQRAHPVIPAGGIAPEQIEVEQQRLRQAIAATLNDLSRLAERTHQLLGKQHAGIFGAQSMLIDDPDLQTAAFNLITLKHCCAAEAWRTELDAMAQAYRELDDPYLQARELDVRDLLWRTLTHLTNGGPEVAQPSAPSVLLGDELFPSEVLMLDRRLTKGVVLSAGSPVSHSAILASALGIPMVVETGDGLKSLKEGERITLDAARGEILRTNG